MEKKKKMKKKEKMMKTVAKGGLMKVGMGVMTCNSTKHFPK